jgi:hypothetical protein
MSDLQNAQAKTARAELEPEKRRHNRSIRTLPTLAPPQADDAQAPTPA